MTPEAARALSTAFQWANLAMSLLILAICLATGYRRHKARPHLVPLITLAVHSIVFYVLALADALPSPWGNLWSAVLRAHSYMMILGMLVLFVLAAMGEPPRDNIEDDGETYPEYYTQQPPPEGE